MFISVNLHKWKVIYEDGWMNFFLHKNGEEKREKADSYVTFR